MLSAQENNMIRTCILGIAFVIVIVSGVVHGLWTDRWGPPAEIDAAAKRLHEANLLRDLGDWQGTKFDVDKKQLDQAGIPGSLGRRYKNKVTGAEVTMVLVCGRSMKVAAHTPDVCYPNAGFVQKGDPKQYTIKDELTNQEGQFWVATFSKMVAGVPTHLRICYAWKDSGPWQAPEDPRMTFVGQTLLYKIYVQREMKSDQETFETDPCKDLIERLLPALETTLNPKKENRKS
jgi:hypothetical protein